MTDKKFAEGLYYSAPHENAPMRLGQDSGGSMTREEFGKRAGDMTAFEWAAYLQKPVQTIRNWAARDGVHCAPAWAAKSRITYRVEAPEVLPKDKAPKAATPGLRYYGQGMVA